MPDVDLHDLDSPDDDGRLRDSASNGTRRGVKGAVVATARGPFPWLVGAAVLLLAGVWAVPPAPLVPVTTAQGVAMLDLDLGEPPSQEWRVEATPEPLWGTAIEMLHVIDGVVAQVGSDIVVRSLADGGTRWSEPDVGSCVVTATITCVAGASTPEATITTYDARDGSAEILTVADATVAAAVEGGVVVVFGAAGQEPRVERLDEAGDVLWSTPLPVDELLTPQERERIAATVPTTLAVSGGSVFSSDWSAAAEFDLESGDILAEQFGVIPTPYGLLTWEDLRSADLRDATGAVVSASGWVAPDDDPGGLTLVTDFMALSARSADGQDVWTADDITAVARMDDVVVGAVPGRADQGTHGFDAATGEELWHVEAVRLPDTPALGSGSAMLMSTVEGQLHAIDVRTGQELWRSDIAGVGGYGYTGDGLIVLSGREMIRLSWPTG